MKKNLQLIKNMMKNGRTQKQVCIMAGIKQVCVKRTYPEEQDIYIERTTKVMLSAFQCLASRFGFWSEIFKPVLDIFQVSLYSEIILMCQQMEHSGTRKCQ